MRICLISREYPPDTGWGGVGAYTYYIANALAVRGHDVEVVTLAAGAQISGTGEPRAVKVHRVQWEHLLDELNLFLVCAPSTHYVVKSAIALWKKFLELHSARHFDVIEAPEHLAAGVFQGVTGLVPLVVKLHTPHSKFVAERFHSVLPSFDNQLICLLERVAMLSADVICSPSIDLAKFVAEDMNLSVEEIVPACNPVDIATFNPRGSRALEKSDTVTILFVGRLEERKGIHYLVEAMPEIMRNVQNARLVIVGADTNTAPGGKSVLAGLKGRLRELGCLQHVTFIPHVPLSQVAGYYRSADICVVPSLYENAPYTCIEAMACGKPVVATSAGGTPEYVQDGERGFVVPPRSSQALAEAIVRLLKDDRLRESFGQRARDFVEKNCSGEAVACRMEKLYEQAIHNHAQKQANLYRKPADRALSDALELLCATDQAIFDVLYAQSLGFRLRHWMRFLRKRPGLFVAHLLVSASRCVVQRGPMPAPILKLEEAIARKQPARYGGTMALGEVIPSSPAPATAPAGHHSER